MNKWLGIGVCQKCGAKETIAHSGKQHTCGRCDQDLWKVVCGRQKQNYMDHGSVHGERKFAKK